MVESGSESHEIWDDIKERAAQMFNFTSPDEKTVEYYLQRNDGKVQIWSKAYPIHKDGRGVAHNFVAEKDTEEEALELMSRLRMKLT
jgi:hypothetical protein